VVSGASLTGKTPVVGEAANPNGGVYVPTFELFHRVGTVCNKAFISRKAGEKAAGSQQSAPEFVGNASDIAILRFCDNLRSSSTTREYYPVDFEIPFNSTNKWMLTICHDASMEDKDGRRTFTMMMKGAPEVILDRCSTYIKNGIEREIDEHFEDEFEEAYERFGNKGSRVIGVAQRTFVDAQDASFSNNTDNYPTENLCFLGLYSITDPPRDGVHDAIGKCHTAGIKVFMVTGDHHLTAKAIAKQVGILREDQNEETDRYAVILGTQIESLTVEDWEEI
jgi:sodium/potassium-transporting ATPase subunit alpha